MIRMTLFALFMMLAHPAGAHPHIFVDTGVEVFTDDQGRMTHIKVTWAYDAFYSLLITEDYGLDPDGDAVLTADEKAKLNGFDMAWVEGFNGDLSVVLAGQDVALSGPRDFTTDMSEGRLVTTHIRDVATAPDLAGAALVIKPYDPTYYTAYDVTYPVTVSGGALCEVRKEEPQMDDQMSALQAALAGIGVDTDPADAGLPNAGGVFATQIEVICSAV